MDKTHSLMSTDEFRSHTIVCCYGGKRKQSSISKHLESGGSKWASFKSIPKHIILELAYKIRKNCKKLKETKPENTDEDESVSKVSTV